MILGLFVMAAVAWIVTLPGVLVALACGAAPALLMSRFPRVTPAIVVTFTAAVAGGLAGSLQLGRGSLAARLVEGIVASLAVAPWTVVLGLVLRARAHPPTGP